MFGNQNVVVYGTGACMQCKATDRALQRAGIEFESVDVAGADSVADQLRKDGWRQLPVVAVDGKPKWAGFRPDIIAGLKR